MKEPSQTPAGLASELLLELGLKPVVRELRRRPGRGCRRWREMGYEVVTGEIIREDTEQAAMVTDSDARHTVRPLARHPVIDRAVALGGPISRLILLHPKSPIYRRLCSKYGADEAPLVDARPRGREVRERQALYVSSSRPQAERAKAWIAWRQTYLGPTGRGSWALLGYPEAASRRSPPESDGRTASLWPRRANEARPCARLNSAASIASPGSPGSRAPLTARPRRRSTRRPRR